MYQIRLTKNSATWYWFTENPQGGGFGSNHVGSKSVALNNALRGIPTGAQFTLTTNGKVEGTFTRKEDSDPYRDRFGGVRRCAT